MGNLFDQGIKAFSANQHYLAIDLFTRAIEAEPNKAEPYAWRAYCLLLLQNYPLALNDCSQAIAINSKSWFCYTVRGHVYRELENYEMALSDHTIAIVLGFDLETKAISYRNRGCVSKVLGNSFAVIADYTSALALQPQDTFLLWNRGQEYLMIGMDSEALTDLLALRTVDPDYHDVLSSQIAELQQCLDDEEDEEDEYENEEDEEDEYDDEEEDEDEEDEYDDDDSDELDLEALLSKLDKLTGLPEVKAEVKSLVNLVRVQQLRRERGFPTPALSLHLIFTGNPGTGKTTVARLISKIYRAMGLLSKGHLVEVDRAGLVAGYVGHTALKVQKVVQKAQGGVLFIDEAYALVQDSKNDFGQEAIDTLLKAMEDYRDRFIVIVAGYPELMEEFLQSNPGLQSRFNKRIFFQNYTVEEMLEILCGLCADYGCSLTELAKDMARRIIAERVRVDSAGFGNGRGVRNLFEQAISTQANRLSTLPSPTDDELCTLIDDDFVDMRVLQTL